MQQAGLAALRRVESSWTGGQTRVLCIGRQILNHWTTREFPNTHFRKISLAAVGWINYSKTGILQEKSQVKRQELLGQII